MTACKRAWGIGALAAALLSACSSGELPDKVADSGALAERPEAGPAGFDASLAGKDASMDATDRATLVDAARALDAAGFTDAVALAEDGAAEAGLPDSGGERACDAVSAPSLPALALREVISGRPGLVFAAQPSDSDDWYLVDQSGRIDVLVQGVVRPTPFLDLGARFSPSFHPADERGLLGLAFHPDYTRTGKVYVMLTPTLAADPDVNRDLVLEYVRSPVDPYQVDADSKKVILALEASQPNHNGGTILFGPDGKLYVGTGDGGGGCNDDAQRIDGPQHTGSLFGKILRLDPDAPAPYAAAGNPFLGPTGDARVLHYGLRNPFRFGFDSRNGDLFIGDVGQELYEEIDFAPADAKGLNFGWAAFEANQTSVCTARLLATGDVHTKPMLEIDRRITSPLDSPFRDYVSIIGGPVYRGTQIPELYGIFFFGDYTGKRMGALRRCGQQTSPFAVIRKEPDLNVPEPHFTVSAGGFRELTAIVQDRTGELYFVANRSSLLRLVSES